MTFESGSDASSGDRTMIDLQVAGLASDRSNRSVGSPERQMIWTLPVLPTLAAISSSISTLSLSARMTIRGLASLSLAMHSSLMMSKMEADQFRMMV